MCEVSGWMAEFVKWVGLGARVRERAAAWRPAHHTMRRCTVHV